MQYLSFCFWLTSQVCVIEGCKVGQEVMRFVCRCLISTEMGTKYLKFILSYAIYWMVTLSISAPVSTQVKKESVLTSGVFSCLLCFKKHWRSAHIYWAPAVYQSLWQTLPHVCFVKVSVSGISSQAVLAGGGTDQRHLSERWVYSPGEIKLQNYQSGLSNLFQLAF